MYEWIEKFEKYLLEDDPYVLTSHDKTILCLYETWKENQMWQGDEDDDQ